MDQQRISFYLVKCPHILDALCKIELRPLVSLTIEKCEIDSIYMMANIQIPLLQTLYIHYNYRIVWMKFWEC